MVLNHHLLSHAYVRYHVYLSRYYTYLRSSDLLSRSEELSTELFTPRTWRIEPNKKVKKVLSGLVEDSIVELDECAVGEVVGTCTSCGKKDGEEKKAFHE